MKLSYFFNIGMRSKAEIRSANHPEAALLRIEIQTS
jgi:hypothetical protein